MASNLLESAVADGIIRLKTDGTLEDGNWTLAIPRIKSFFEKSRNRVTLFLGAAISTFKPAQLPMWNQFIQLIWNSVLQHALEDLDQSEVLESEYMEFFNSTHPKISNYLITEIVARRLGLQYHDLLKAFEAIQDENDNFPTNDIHKWVAKCLMTGQVASVVTTNFDDYFERALDDSGASSYQVTGDLYHDGEEISARLRDIAIDNRLVLIVNGAKASLFVRSLMPQLGKGKITFLFKLHGSCYDPTTCIDTRLQRSQGLPSYCTDILDTLLKRTTWVVAGFSGSDMNDNLDYIRLLSNKKHTRVVWMEYSSQDREVSIQRLRTELDMESDIGLCLIGGSFMGDRITQDDEFAAFNRKVFGWANSLGNDWCRLVLIDLMILLQSRTGIIADARLFHVLNGGELPRQDWNRILSRLEFEDKTQMECAELCFKVWSMLETIDNSIDLPQANENLKALSQKHDDLERDAMIHNPPRMHAQSWIPSGLSGLIFLYGGKTDEAIHAFQISSNMSWLVGDYETHQLIEKMIVTLSQDTPATPELSTTVDSRLIALTPSLDNVKSKTNRFGIPPAYYIRSLLHRSIVFADGIIIPSNVMCNSSVFLDEVLFHQDNLNLTYFNHLHPLLPSYLENVNRKLHAYRSTRDPGFILETLNEKHLDMMDELFDRPEHSGRIIYYDESVLQRDYGYYLRKSVHPDQSEETVRHLRGIDDNEEVARDILRSMHHFTTHLPPAITRSTLYRFADLFEEASHSDSIIGKLLPETSEDSIREIKAARSRMIEAPWVYGPFAHEIFDAPYITNLAFNIESKSMFLFLDPEERSSWNFIANLRSHGQLVDVDSAIEHEVSSLLLSQASMRLLLRARDALSPLREKLINNSVIDDEFNAQLKREMKRFESRASKIPNVGIDGMGALDTNLQEMTQKLLKHCVFLVRRGEPLHPMYEEAQVLVPGLVELRRS